MSKVSEQLLLHHVGLNTRWHIRLNNTNQVFNAADSFTSDDFFFFEEEEVGGLNPRTFLMPLHESAAIIEFRSLTKYIIYCKTQYGRIAD